MCGIAGFYMRNPNSLGIQQYEDLLDGMLLSIEHRGMDATGFASALPEGKGAKMEKKAEPARSYILDRAELGARPRMVIAHTRFATQGHQSDNSNNHPVLHGTTFVTHNGHISNDAELFRDFELSRFAEVDSEIIPALLNHYGLDDAEDALEQLLGGFAIAAMDPVHYPDYLLLAKGHTSPLYIYENSNMIVWASTPEAITEPWGWVIGTPPKENRFIKAEPGDIFRIDASGTMTKGEFKVKQRPAVTYTSGRSTSYGGYYNWDERDGVNRSEMCSCLHTRFWHCGKDYTDSCAKQGCGCEAFDSMSEDKGVECESCMDTFPDYLLDEYLGVVLCKACADDPRTWDSITYSDDTNSCSVGGFSFRGQEVEVIDGEAISIPTFRTENERHEWIIQQVAAETGQHPKFVDWILFHVTLEALDEDVWLQEARQECEDSYCSFEEVLNANDTPARERLLLVQGGADG